ncbi:MAG: hypothetical protein Q8P84_04200 [Deltaproteobacteria bacterium]|nr:hypothetical protein [Deltaproteobacteria bacterium]
MANVEKPCMAVGKENPWVKPFDQFGQNWKAGPNGQIDDADLERWRSLYMREAGHPSQVDIPSFPSSALCPYFRADMYRRQFEEMVVKPEKKRNEHLTDDQKGSRAYRVTLLQLKLKENIEKVAQTVVPRTTNYFDEMNYWIEGASKYVLDNLKWDQSKLCGVGISYDTTIPFKVDFVLSGGPANGLIESGAIVLAVDGGDVSTLPTNIVANRIRGPQNTFVTLTLVSPESGEVQNQTFQRSWCQPKGIN